MHYPNSKNPWLAAVIFKAYTVQSNPPQRSYNNRSVSHNLCFLPQGKVADLTVSHKNKQRKFKPIVYNYSGSIFYVSNTLFSTEKPPFHPMISIPHLKVFIALCTFRCSWPGIWYRPLCESLVWHFCKIVWQIWD